MKPLSSLKYIKSNTRKVIVTFISILIGVFMVYFYALITDTSDKLMDVMGTNLLKEYTIIYPKTKTGIPNEFINQLKNGESTKEIIPFKVSSGSYRYYLGLGSSGTDIFNLFSKDVPKFLKGLDLKLVEGQLPVEGSKDILLSMEFAKQNDLKIGSVINDNTSRITLKDRYTVCGIVEGPSIIVLTCTNTDGINYEDAYKWGIIYSSKDKSQYDMASSNKYEDKIAISDLNSNEKQMESITAMAKSFTYIMSGFIIVVLCITLGNLNYITFTNRMQEFFILNSIGYTKGYLMKKLWKENALVCLFGYVSGLALTIIVISLINLAVLSPQGKPLLLWSINGAAASVTLPIFISIFSIIPCLTSKYTERF